MTGGLENKSDLQLVEMLQGEDPQEIAWAKEILFVRYQGQVKNYASTILRGNKWVEAEDITQETFLKFFNYVSINKLKARSAKNLLMKITKGKCIDTLRIWEREWKFENDNPLTKDTDESANRTTEEHLISKEGLQKLPILLQCSFTKLSDCQRLVWALRTLYQYDPRAIARLMGKRRGTIDTHFSDASKRLNKYVQSEDYELDLANQELKGLSHRERALKPGLIIERFINPIVPQLTPDELKPLSVTVEKFQEKYVAFLMFPWGYQNEKLIENDTLYLLLTTEEAWKHTQKMMEQQVVERGETKHLNLLLNTTSVMYPTPLIQYLIKIKIDGDNIVLIPQSIVAFLPTVFPSEEMENLGFPPPDCYLSLHTSRHLIPAVVWLDPDTTPNPMLPLIKRMREDPVFNSLLSFPW